MEIILAIIAFIVIFQVLPYIIGGAIGLVIGSVQLILTNLDRIIPAIVLYLPLKILQLTNFLQYFFQKPWRYFLRQPGSVMFWIYRYRLHWIAELA